MAYDEFDPNKPDPAVDNGSTSCTNSQKNFRAVRDSAIALLFKGFAYAQSGGTAEEPTTITLTRGTTIIRLTNTWGTSGGSLGQRTKVKAEISYNSGAAYEVIQDDAGSASDRTYDASGNLTAAAGSASLLDKVMEWFGKIKALRTSYNAHAAATGTAVHGLGTISTQSAAAVAITGGTINNTTIGVTTQTNARFTNAIELHVAYTPGSGAGVTLDLSRGSSKITNSGTNTITFSNAPPSGFLYGHVLEVTNLNNTNFPAAVDWGLGGKPSVAGAAVVSMITNNGASVVRAALVWRAV